MARSAAAKGSYYKLRTKRWLEAQGYVVAYLERLLWIPNKKDLSRMIPVKQDQLGSDLLAMNVEELIFVQVKLGTSGVAKAVKTFATFPFPPTVQRWVVCWTPRAREPHVIDCAERVA